MEKRLFLAVFLSLGIVFFFQIFFGQKPLQTQAKTSDQSQTVDTKDVAVDVTLKNAPAAGSVTAGTCAGVVKDFHNCCYYGDT